MTHRDKAKVNRIAGMRPVVQRYYAFKDQCRLHKVWLPTSGAKVVFFLPMPKSWSKKKKEQMMLQPHRTKPDLSNLIKALEDAIYEDDSSIWYYGGLEKYWDYKGSMEIHAPSTKDGG